MEPLPTPSPGSESGPHFALEPASSEVRAGEADAILAELRSPVM